VRVYIEVDVVSAERYLVNIVVYVTTTWEMVCVKPPLSTTVGAVDVLNEVIVLSVM
jgi:hypothetical protein